MRRVVQTVDDDVFALTLGPDGGVVLAVAGGDGKKATSEIAGLIVPGDPLAVGAGDQRAEAGVEFGADDGEPRTRLHQTARLFFGHPVASEDDTGLALKVEKDWVSIAHASLLSQQGPIIT